MNYKKDLIKNTLIISIGKFSTKIVSFLLLPLYTSILSTAQYGEYDLLNTISIFLMPVITLQMEEAMFRFLIDAKNDRDKKHIFSQTVCFAICGVIAWSLIIFVVGSILNYQYKLWLIMYCLASTMYTITSAFSRGEGRFKLYAILAFLNSLFNILLNILFVAVFRLGLSGLFISYTISGIVVGLYGLFKLKAYKYLSFKAEDKVLLKEMIKFSLPLVPNSVSWSIISLSNRLIITDKLGIDYNGIYSVGNKFPTIINTCYGFFNTSWRESASKVLKDENHDIFYNSVYLNLKRFLFGVSIIMIGLLPFVFSILVNKNYHDAYQYIPLMIISVYFANLSSFSNGIFSAYKDTKILAPTTVVAAIINIVISLSLINKIGLYAPVFGTMAAYFLIYIYRNYKLRRYVTLSHDKYLITNCLVMGLMLFTYYNNSRLINFLGLVVSLIYASYINRSLIKKLYKTITNKLHKNK